MPAIQFVLPFRARRGARRGVTLLELLVVLVLMGVSAALVLPVLDRPDGAQRMTEAELISLARRMAIGRAEPLRLRLDSDGVWAVVSAREGTPIRSGRIDLAPNARAAIATSRLDLSIDALGTCMPSADVARSALAANGNFDPLACEFVSEFAREATR